MEETVIIEESTEEPKKRKRAGRPGKPDKPKKSRKGLIIALAIVLALIVIAAVVVFVVYSGMHMYLKAELGEGAPSASGFLKGEGEASYVLSLIHI